MQPRDAVVRVLPFEGHSQECRQQLGAESRATSGALDGRT